jgi:hypothetical protein
MDKPSIDFIPFPKIARFNREVVVTEKLDGTNAQIFIDDTGTQIHAGSRTRWIVPGDDNYGFAAWVEQNRDELLKLGPGSHFGEWWGAGIQRKYGLTEKRFSLFNVSRWGDAATRPTCCDVVPVLWRGNFEEFPLADTLARLRSEGSAAAPGFMQPEGIVVYHVASGALFKKLLEGDALPKGLITHGERQVVSPLGSTGAA